MNKKKNESEKKRLSCIFMYVHEAFRVMKIIKIKTKLHKHTQNIKRKKKIQNK